MLMEPYVFRIDKCERHVLVIYYKTDKRCKRTIVHEPKYILQCWEKLCDNPIEYLRMRYGNVQTFYRASLHTSSVDYCCTDT